MPYAARPVAERFWEKVSKDGPVPAHRPDLGPCWLWTGGINRQRGGYGMFALRKGVIRRSHRIAWELASGADPGGLWVLHHCDNPPCVRPEHLFLGTPRDNSGDMEAKGRGNHPHGSARPQAKITEADVLAIREARQQGATGAELARQYGVHRTAIYHICQRDYWKHV
jgi:hypothetical protein